MKKITILSLMILLVLVAYSPAKATLFVSGDSNIIDPLTPGIDTGNQQFFTNILGGGNSVAVLHSTVPSGSDFVGNVNQFYNSLSGVTSTVITGPITSLTGYNLLVAPLPDHVFSSSEITALGNFLAGGGSVFFLGENGKYFNTTDTDINMALAALGSSMQIIPDTIDVGWHTATGAQIATDPLTAGVTTLSYAWTSQVSNGTFLFFGTGGQPFVEYTIPEPATMLLLGLGLMGLAGVRRKFKK
jgi:hypothetical protein